MKLIDQKRHIIIIFHYKLVFYICKVFFNSRTRLPCYEKSRMRKNMPAVIHYSSAGYFISAVSSFRRQSFPAVPSGAYWTSADTPYLNITVFPASG
jgi:hypothetical protein